MGQGQGPVENHLPDRADAGRCAQARDRRGAGNVNSVSVRRPDVRGGIRRNRRRLAFIDGVVVRIQGARQLGCRRQAGGLGKGDVVGPGYIVARRTYPEPSVAVGTSGRDINRRAPDHIPRSVEVCRPGPIAGIHDINAVLGCGGLVLRQHPVIR